MDVLKPTAEHLANYIQFWIEFLYPPARPLKQFEGANKVEPQLIIFLGISFLVSWLIGYVSSIVFSDEQVRAITDKITYNDIPKVGLALTLITLFISAAWHGAARLLLSLNRWSNSNEQKFSSLEARLGGNVYDTINGVLGFVAFFLPLSVVYVVLSLRTIKENIGPQVADLSLANVVLALALGALFYIYLATSLAATHKETSALQSFWTVATVGSVIAALISMFLLVS
jgi:hypothetical protein